MINIGSEVNKLTIGGLSHWFESRSQAAVLSLGADIGLEREAAISQPGMAETYGCPTEILSNKHTNVKNLHFQLLPLPYYITLLTS